MEEFKVYYVLFLCGFGDYVTTNLGLSFGFNETCVIGFVPFLSTLLFFGAAYLIMWLNGPKVLKEVLCVFMVMFAFSGFANNVCVLLGVQSLSVLG